jgi:TolA-binding protein
MNAQVKLGLYVITVLGTLIFGTLFVSVWRQSQSPPASVAQTVAEPESPPPVALPDSPAEAGTNALATTDATDTTNAPAENNLKQAANERSPESEPLPEGTLTATRGLGRVLLWGLLATASLVGLVGLGAYDLSQFAGQRATETLFDDQGEDVTATTYEQVEAAYGNGDYLEAIRLLRTVLEETPKAVHAKIRIAEIYEKDLNNPLAAALEFEEVIQGHLDPERKSWTMIHLVNLYNRLDKPQTAVAMLQRVAAEYPDTPAAAKARDRLSSAGFELPDPAPASEVSPSSPPTSPESSSRNASSGLPPGFRPKR